MIVYMILKLKKLANNEAIIFIVSGKHMDLYDLNKNLKVARKTGFLFIHENKLTIKLHSHQRYIIISYYLKS